MISGTQGRQVASYTLIDHAGIGNDPVKPRDGEVFTGIPYQTCSDESFPFIEIRRDGHVVATVNALDCMAIEFVTD